MMQQKHDHLVSWRVYDNLEDSINETFKSQVSLADLRDFWLCSLVQPELVLTTGAARLFGQELSFCDLIFVAPVLIAFNVA